MKNLPRHELHVMPGVLFSALFAVCRLFVSAQTPADTPELHNNDLSGLHVSASTQYDGSALYGFMDGGADLYREYGFVRLSVQDVTVDSTEFSVEVYEMSDPVAAFGIFSVARGGCKGSKALGPHSCVSPYLSMFAHDNWYVRVINYSGKNSVEGMGEQIGVAVRLKLDGNTLALPAPFLGTGSVDVLCVRGLLGIQNSKPEWEEYFEGVKRFDLWFIPLRRDQEMTFALAVFSAPADCDTVLRRLDQDRNVRARRRDEHSLVWLSDIPPQISPQSLDSLLNVLPQRHRGTEK